MSELQSLPIVDAHHHFWDTDRNYHPWLRDEPPIPFRYGDYSAIRRNYLPADYAADSGNFNVVATVLMEGEWDPQDPLGEARWVHELAAQHNKPDAMVAQAWLDDDAVEDLLAAYAALPLVRGIRHKPHSAVSAAKIAPRAPGSMSDPRWRRGYALLSHYDLSFDLQTPYWHLPEALELVSAFPETQLILNHSGLPADRSKAGLAAWRAGLGELARAPNVVLKLSGIGLPGQPWRVEDNRHIVLQAIDIFGVERCLFASNFPVDKLTGSYPTIMSGYLSIVAELPRGDQLKLFHDNAVRVYRLDRAMLASP